MTKNELVREITRMIIEERGFSDKDYQAIDRQIVRASADIIGGADHVSLKKVSSLVRAVVSEVFGCMSDILYIMDVGDKIQVNGLGKFSRVIVPSREYNLPQGLGKKTIEEYTTIRFSSSNKLKT